MTTNLTANKIKDTYSQLLHVDGGPAATEKVVYSGTGVATALKVGTVSASAGNVRIAGNTISSIDENGDITLSPNGTGSVVIPKIDFTDPAQARAELGLGTAALAATGSFATAAQGALADSALQPGDPISVAFGDVTGRAHGIFYDLSDQTFYCRYSYSCRVRHNRACSWGVGHEQYADHVCGCRGVRDCIPPSVSEHR